MPDPDSAPHATLWPVVESLARTIREHRPTNGNHPGLGAIAELIGADGTELWVQRTTDGPLERIARQRAAEQVSGPVAATWHVGANDPFFPAVADRTPVMYEPRTTDEGVVIACAAPFAVAEDRVGLLVAWPGDRTYGEADCAAFLDVTVQLGDLLSPAPPKPASRYPLIPVAGSPTADECALPDETARRDRYEELRLDLDALITRKGSTSEALNRIAVAFGADHVILLDGLSEDASRTTWRTERWATLDRVLVERDARTPLLLECADALFAEADIPLSLERLNAPTRELLADAEIDHFTTMGAHIADGEHQLAIGVTSLRPIKWSERDHLALKTILRQLRTGSRASELDHESEMRQRMAALVKSVADTALGAVESTNPLADSLRIVRSALGALGAAWVQFDQQASSYEVISAVDAHGQAYVPPPLAVPEGMHEQMWAGGARPRWCGPDDPMVTTLKALAPHLEWSPRVIAPVFETAESAVTVGILDVQLPEDPRSEELLESCQLIARLLDRSFTAHTVRERLHALFESAPSGQLILDDQLRVRACNARVRETFGDLTGLTWTDLDPDFSVSGEGREIRLSHGRAARWVNVRGVEASPIDWRARYVVHVEDVTTQRTAQAVLEYDANHDHLTGLGNRRLLSTRLSEHLAAGATTLMILDVDRFNAVNESLGPATGDELLVELSRRLESAVHDEATVCRIGGDEFAIVLPGRTDDEAFAQCAERVLEAVRAPLQISGHQLYPSCSMGAAEATGVEASETLHQHAHWATHEAKRSGGDRVEVFQNRDLRALRNRLDEESALRKALTEDQFVAHFQPEYDLATEQLIGVEALVRWARPGHGIVGAGAFIELAEEIGLASLLSEAVLEQAFAAAVDWRRHGFTPQVRVNLTAAQLQSGDLFADVSAALARYDLPASQVCLEVTERSIMLDLDTAIRSIEAVRSLGIEVAIDDFGTGHSSLAWLKRLPVDTLKIDKSFIDGIDTDSADRQIVQTIMQLADGLGLDVVAEGVERPSQAAVLREFGCRRAQGWLWSKAIPADAILSQLRKATEPPLTSTSGCPERDPLDPT